ncbi:MAG: hypothetical protein J0L84_03420, partial [Verrucomicrobia bacterium]|nr:hypothetical protein [Verrucomicrobiota bacterium]
QMNLIANCLAAVAIVFAFWLAGRFLSWGRSVEIGSLAFGAPLGLMWFLWPILFSFLKKLSKTFVVVALGVNVVSSVIALISTPELYSYIVSVGTVSFAVYFTIWCAAVLMIFVLKLYLLD